tara:strand:- start:230 stop:367 length:138 start_codon:yes stop_codon:yes gene_type:complete
MITKTEIWGKIKQELIEYKRSKSFTTNLMKIIKEVPQDENKNRGA